MKLLKQNTKNNTSKSNFSSKDSAIFLTPFKNVSNFTVETMDSTDTDSPILLKKALVAVEGKFEDSNGKPHEFSAERLQTIAEHSNRALEKGITIPVCKDHNKTVENTIGNLTYESKFYTKVIQQEDLPNPRATELVGRLGLFADGAAITDFDAQEKIRNKTVTSVSMGLNLDPQDHRLIELSLVPIPAIPHMGFFKSKYSNFATSSDLSNKNIFSWEDLEVEEQTLDTLQGEYAELADNLWLILNNIYNSESIDINDLYTLQQYVYNTLNGFSIRVLDLLGLSQVTDPNMAMQADTTAMNADQMQQMQATQAQDLGNIPANVSQPAMYSKRVRPELLAKFAKYYGK